MVYAEDGLGASLTVPAFLGLLNLGASEVILILLVLLVLFGADKAPQLARSIGKARAQMDQVRGQFTDALRTEEDRAWEDQLAFERERDRQVAASVAQERTDTERAALHRAAQELGLQTQGLTDEEIQAAIAARAK